MLRGLDGSNYTALPGGSTPVTPHRNCAPLYQS